SVVAGAAVALIGGARIQVAGPTGAFIGLLGRVVELLRDGGLQEFTRMPAGMMGAMGRARLDAALRFIPYRVFVGDPPGVRVYLLLLQPAATALAVVSLLLALWGPRRPGLARVPGPLLAMLAATVAVAVWNPPGVATIASTFGDIPRALPTLQVPEMSFDLLVVLLPSAFTIAMLGAIESLLSAVVADGMAGTRHDSNQELVGQGIANILSPLFGGIAATGAIARTATSIRNGATSPLAALVHCVLLVAVLVFLAPYAGQVPLAALAAILWVVAWNMS